MIEQFQAARKAFFLQHGRYPSDRENERLEQDIINQAKQKQLALEKQRQDKAEAYKRAKGS